MSRLQGYIRPFNFSSRDKALYSHLRSGQPLTSQKLLEMDFGGHMPGGVHITGTNEKTLDIRSTFADKAMPLIMKPIMAVMAAGYVQTPDARHRSPDAQPYDRAIYMNNVMFSPVGQAGMGFIGANLVHSLVTIAALGSPLLFLKSFTLLAVMACSSLRLSPLVQLGALIFRPGMDTIGHEHIHVLQSDDSLSKKTGFDMLENTFRKKAEEKMKAEAPLRRALDKGMSFMMSGYFLNDYEIQARLHVVMAHGHQRWGRLPQTRHELWGALIDSGLSAPAKIHEELKNSKEAGLKDFYKPSLSARFNQAARAGTDPSAAELNVAYRAHILSDLKDSYWTDTLPYLYGHMVELYGDADGRRRMGYDPARPYDFTVGPNP